MAEQLTIEMLRQLDADVRDLRTELRSLRDGQEDHAARVETRMDNLESVLALHRVTGNGDQIKGKFHQWKDIVLLALVAKLAGVNVAQLFGALP